LAREGRTGPVERSTVSYHSGKHGRKGVRSCDSALDVWESTFNMQFFLRILMCSGTVESAVLLR
jgi:hypothetical protein